MFVPTPFGIMLKEKRENSKLSQGELSQELGKTAQYISNIEKGKNNSPPDDADLAIPKIKKQQSGEVSGSAAFVFTILRAAAASNDFYSFNTVFCKYLCTFRSILRRILSMILHRSVFHHP